MLICGIKATHDAGVAVVVDGRLLFAVELEKLDDRPRYSELDRLEAVERILADHGLVPGDVDRFVLDGWGYGEVEPSVTTMSAGRAVRLRVAPYREGLAADESLAAYQWSGLPLGEVDREYRSYHHTAGHVMSAYCTSPFASRGEPAHVVVWDGGVSPRGYYVDPEAAVLVEGLGPVFGLIGNVYAGFAVHFPPFDAESSADRFRQLSVAGKVMAYTALGRVDPGLLAVFDQIYDEELEFSLEFADALAESFQRRTRGEADPQDALATFQHWLGTRLLSGLRAMRDAGHGRSGNLVFAGGCALNIKWNGRIRDSEIFDDCWVPPFPNDSGSAIGAACAEMAVATGTTALKWSVYSGPALRTEPAGPRSGYRARACSVAELAGLLHAADEPIVVLHGRAELGPRALGNRSIIAAPTSAGMKDLLNELKIRENYRPVSPICLADEAPKIFDPGTPDPYMLFDHRLRPEWAERIPAVLHLDGSARLQTVDHEQNPLIAELLTEYARLSGIPVLCNTSANLKGSGFFPGVASALRWGRTRYVWSEGTLWERTTALAHGAAVGDMETGDIVSG